MQEVIGIWMHAGLHCEGTLAKTLRNDLLLIVQC